MMVSSEQMDKVTDSLAKTYADMNSVICDTMNALLQSTSVVTKGYTDVCDSVNSWVQISLESASKTGKSLMCAKNINDVMEMQTAWVKNSFDTMVSETNKISQISARLAQQAAEPVANQVNTVVTKMAKRKAA